MKNPQSNNAVVVPAVTKAPKRPRRQYDVEFYRDGFRSMTTFVMAFCILDVVLVVAMFAIHSSRDLPDVYASTRGGMLVKLATTSSAEVVPVAPVAQQGSN